MNEGFKLFKIYALTPIILYILYFSSMSFVPYGVDIDLLEFPVFLFILAVMVAYDFYFAFKYRVRLRRLVVASFIYILCSGVGFIFRVILVFALAGLGN